MPTAPPRICTHPGCNTLTLTGRCDKHPKKAWNHSKSAKERGYGWQWQKLRKQIMERDGWLCQVCMKEYRPTPATEVDHILPKARGGSDSPDNLQAICRDCHKAKTAREAH